MIIFLPQYPPHLPHFTPQIHRLILPIRQCPIMHLRRRMQVVPAKLNDVFQCDARATAHIHNLTLAIFCMLHQAMNGCCKIIYVDVISVLPGG